MLILNFSKLWKMTSSIGLRKNFSTIKQNTSFQYDDNHYLKKIDEIHKVCIKHGVSSNVISENKWIFNMNIVNISHGLSFLNSWNPKQMDDLFVLLQMPTKKLFYITKKIKSESSIVVPHTNRVYYFAENFEKSPQDVCYHLMHRQTLFTRKFTCVREIYQLLMENNVNKNDLWQDIWVFMYSRKNIEQRIARIKMTNIAIKPWMLHCKKEIFDRTIKIKQESRVILNTNSTAQYLAKRLKVSENKIRYISLKYPLTLRVSPIKLKEILDFLLREGFKSSEILNTPRVFTHSISTLQERLTEMRDLGYEPSIAVLCQNQTRYQELTNKLISKNYENFKN